MTTGGEWTPIGALREDIATLHRRIDRHAANTDRKTDNLSAEIDRLVDRVYKVEARINMAIGGIAVIGITAVVNVVTNILQASGS